MAIMTGSRLFIFSCICATLSAGFLSAQKRVPELQPPHRQQVPNTYKTAASPFALESKSHESFRVIPAARMSSADKDLLARAQSELHRQAELFDLGYSQSGWILNQIACPGFPNHLFLRFLHDEGENNLTMFSASIPRDGRGGVHVIPILRGSFAPFTPAPGNPLSIATFNRILAEEKTASKPYWLNVGICYAALLGADPKPQAADTDATAVADNEPQSMPVLSIAKDRDVMHFSTSYPRPLVWRLAFNRNGTLVEAGATSSMKLMPVSKEKQK